MDLASLKARLIREVALRCSAAGYRAIALYGAGRHTLPIIRQPWQWADVRVVAIIDDAPREPRLAGIPVVRPQDLSIPIDAIVISSDTYEHQLFQQAVKHFGGSNIPIIRIYADDTPARDDPAVSIRRLITRWGLSPADAAWLVENRDERHDATLPMLPPERTEMHLRRYELVAPHCENKHILDIASGTGYGSRFLLDQGRAASVLGLDIEPRCIDYATRRFAMNEPAGRLRYDLGDAANLTLPDASIDVIASFETIEHVPDASAAINHFRRVLRPGGRLFISTPNDTGPTPHHAHSFTPAQFASLLRAAFPHTEFFAQTPGDTPQHEGLPPGIYRESATSPRPAILIASCTKPTST